MISEETLKKTWDKIDDLVKWNDITGNMIVGTILEMADNAAGPYALDFINEKVITKLPQDVHDNIERALIAWINEDYDGVVNEIPGTVDELINVKQLSDTTEEALSAAIFKAAVEFIQFYSNKSSTNSQPPSPGTDPDEEEEDN